MGPEKIEDVTFEVVDQDGKPIGVSIPIGHIEKIELMDNGVKSSVTPMNLTYEVTFSGNISKKDMRRIKRLLLGKKKKGRIRNWFKKIFKRGE